MTAEATT